MRVAGWTNLWSTDLRAELGGAEMLDWGQRVKELRCWALPQTNAERQLCCMPATTALREVETGGSQI